MSISISHTADFGFARSARTRSSHLRVTKRGRAVLLSLVGTPLVIGALVVGINAGGATATSSATPLKSVTVSSGETLWQLARHIAPAADPRDVVSDIMNVNQLTTSDLYPGERLEIPAQYNH